MPEVGLMPHVLAALTVFVAEDQRCGEQESGLDKGYVWMRCSCSGLIMQPSRERPGHAAAVDPAGLAHLPHHVR